MTRVVALLHDTQLHEHGPATPCRERRHDGACPGGQCQASGEANVGASTISRSRTCPVCPCLACPCPLCENFLYGFQGGPPAARAADSARSPSLPLALPLRRRRSAGAKSMKPGRLIYSKFPLCRRGVPAPAAGIVRGRSEPVKAVCGCRTTAPVELPGERAREDGLDRTCRTRRWQLSGAGTRVARDLWRLVL